MRSITTCPNGHRYNSDINDKCPYCEREKANNSSVFSEINMSDNTVPIGGWNSSTVPDSPWNFGTERVGDGDQDGRTVPLGSNNYENNLEDEGTQVLKKDHEWGSPNHTEEPELKTTGNYDEYQHQPVVGWLVCIEGPDKGKDFCLHGAKSTIGRRAGSAVCLTDLKIARTGFPALIVYDDRKTHRFYLASGDASAQNNVELDGNMLLGQSIIEPYAEIRIEDTVLVFVPFCGDDFYWKEN